MFFNETFLQHIAIIRMSPKLFVLSYLWKRWFQYDRDRTGHISLHELRAIINSREYEKDIPERVVVRIMQIADRDNSGHLDFDEFLAMIHHPVLKGVFGHLVERYVHMVIPPRRHVDTIGNYKKYSGIIIYLNTQPYLCGCHILCDLLVAIPVSWCCIWGSPTFTKHIHCANTWPVGDRLCWNG